MEYTTQAGKQVVINYAGFKDACELKRQVGIELLKVNVNIDDLINKELDSKSINTFKNLLFTIDSSKEIEDCLFRCLSRSLYNNSKITRELFEDKEVVHEYYDIMIACMRENLSPFFEKQFAVLSELLIQAKNILKSLPEKTPNVPS